MTDPKKLKVGVKAGAGEPPGYFWSVGVIDFVFDEAMKLVNESQYKHLAMQVKDLACHIDPSHSSTVDISTVEEFYEIRDKGGPLVLQRLYFLSTIS